MEYNGKNMSHLVFEDLSKANDIQLALNTPVIRIILTIYCNATFTIYKFADRNSVSSEKRTLIIIWKIRNREGGLLAPTLGYEFPGVTESIPMEYSREQRFAANSL
jgi:hypothetical protein